MEDLAALFDAFYTRFVLRDLLAKITPGAIVLVAIFTIFIWQPENVAHYLAGLTFWAWTILLAFSWITGMTIQSIGEFLGMIRYYPKKDKKDNELDRKEWYKLRVEFSKWATPDEERVDERFIVIKEACGNGSIALLVVSILLAVKIFLLVPQLFCLMFSTLLLALFGFKALFTLLPGILICWIISKEPSIYPFIQRLKESLVAGGCDNIGILLIGLIIAIIFTFALYRMHREHVQRQYDHMLTVIDC